LAQSDESRDQLASPNNGMAKGWQVVRVEKTPKKRVMLAHGLLKTCFVDEFWLIQTIVE
jgi:hypothetical protein